MGASELNLNDLKELRCSGERSLCRGHEPHHSRAQRKDCVLGVLVSV